MTDPAEIKALLNAAAQDEAIAAKHGAAGESRQAISRAYYASFYYVTAVLRTRDLAFKSHRAAIAAFNREFVHGGVFPREDYTAVKNAFGLRHEADYRLITHGETVVTETLAAIKALGQHARDYLKPYVEA